MNCYQLYEKYRNQIVEIQFKDGSNAKQRYGNKLVGYIYYPDPNSAFYTQDSHAEYGIMQGQLVCLPFKLSPGYKLKHGISDKIETELFQSGFNCNDVSNVLQLSDMQLEVSGNINQYIIKRQTNYQQYSISGTWTFPLDENSMRLAKCDTGIMVKNSSLLELCDQIRGIEYEKAATVFRKKNVHLTIDYNNALEIDLIKALCNLFVWLEYYFVAENIAMETSNLIANKSFLPKMYDEFIIDLNTEFSRQREMYLIKHEYQTPEHIELCDRLMEMNLLSKVSLKVRGERYENYFLPFFKLIHNMTSDSKYYKFYVQLLNDRDACIKNHFKQ